MLIISFKFIGSQFMM